MTGEAGKRFGRLVAIKDVGRLRGGVLWLCKCDCGEESMVIASKLKNGCTKSCGCLRSEMVRARTTTHRRINTREYKTWNSMKNRCSNPNVPNYHNYGGRGIRVCDEWMKFENFYRDMGERPDGHSLERINNNMGYSPDNCKWATQKEQCRNQRTNKLVTCHGETLSLIEWAEKIGVNRETINTRLRRGWPTERALFKPIGKYRR